MPPGDPQAVDADESARLLLSLAYATTDDLINRTLALALDPLVPLVVSEAGGR